MSFRRFAKFLTFGIALVVVTGASAAPTSYGTYYDETPTTASCPASSICRLNFTQLPPNKLTLAHKIHCVFASTSPVTLATLSVATTSGGSAIPRYVQLPVNYPPSAVSGLYYASVDTEARYLMGQSRFPFVQVITAALSPVFGVDCTLSGELMDPIP